MSISEYADAIDAILTGTGDADSKAEALLSLSQEMRRICWAHNARDRARQVWQRADREARTLTGAFSLPRFSAFESGGIIHRAIY